MNSKEIKQLSFIELFKLAFFDALLLTLVFGLMNVLSSILKTKFTLSVMLHNFADHFREITVLHCQVLLVSFLVICSILIVKKILWQLHLWYKKRVAIYSYFF